MAEPRPLTLPCSSCGKEFEPTALQRTCHARGQKIRCSRACRKWQPVNNWESVETPCGGCGRSFRLQDRGQLAMLRKGRAVFCSKKCRNRTQRIRAETRTDRPQHGPCRKCGRMFHSRVPKTYCSLECYRSDPQTTERLRRLVSLQIQNSRVFPSQCRQCGVWIANQHFVRQFCTKICQRRFYVERFDRFIANPEFMPLPQNYDEFLLQDRLPCLFEGCTWVGLRLSQHCNLVHGVTAAKLKEMAGFNHTTGLVPPDEHLRMSALARDLVERGLTGHAFLLEVERQRAARAAGPVPHGPTGIGRIGRRLEGAERSAKVRILLQASGPRRPPTPCPACGRKVDQPVCGRKIFCSAACRDSFQQKRQDERVQAADPLVCDHCGRSFGGNAEQLRRAARSLPVCCSHDCRNKRNIDICLEKRKNRRVPQASGNPTRVEPPCTP